MTYSHSFYEGSPDRDRASDYRLENLYCSLIIAPFFIPGCYSIVTSQRMVLPKGTLEVMVYRWHIAGDHILRAWCNFLSNGPGKTDKFPGNSGFDHISVFASKE